MDLKFFINFVKGTAQWDGSGRSFKGLLQDGGQVDFSQNLRPSLLKDFSTEPNFSRIHLAGQYL